jgi:hypothetical protein
MHRRGIDVRGKDDKDFQIRDFHVSNALLNYILLPNDSSLNFRSEFYENIGKNRQDKERMLYFYQYLHNNQMPEVRMIKHIVMFSFKEFAEGMNKEQIISEIKARFEALPDKIPFLRTFEVGRNIGVSPFAYDLILYSQFVSLEQLEQYQIHPAHEDIKAFLNNLKEQVAAVDYEA